MFFPEERERLRQAKLQYFGREDDSHIIYLLSKSRLGIGQEKKKNFGIVRELYKKLDTIPEISTVLKVVESSALTEIIFDFDNDSIVDLDPTKSSETKGFCYYREGRIYIGAKEQSKLLSTLSLDPTKSSETKGSSYYREGRIYIGAKEQSKLLSTLSLDRT